MAFAWDGMTPFGNESANVISRWLQAGKIADPFVQEIDDGGDDHDENSGEVDVDVPVEVVDWDDFCSAVDCSDKSRLVLTLELSVIEIPLLDALAY